MVDKKDGDGNGKDNVIPFPTKSTPEQDPRMIGLIVREVLDDLVGQLSPEQRKEFESFLYDEKPDLAHKLFSSEDGEFEFVGEFSVEELDDHITKCEQYLDLSFEYIKNIERMMFRLNQEMRVEEMSELRDNLQKLWLDLQKKVDFE